MPKGDYLTRPQFGVPSDNAERAAVAWLEKHVGTTGEAVMKSLAAMLRQDETGWLIERANSEASAPWYWCGGGYAEQPTDTPGWPMFCRDLKQAAVACGDPQLPVQKSTEHDALCDARWTKAAWDWLVARQRSIEQHAR